jgi:hypothetical protein
MSGEATRADAPLPGPGNDAYAATLDEPSRSLSCSHGLGGEASTRIDAVKIYRYLLGSLLRVGVFAEGIAQAASCFAADLSAKTTGNILDVDAENAAALAR